MKRNFPIPPHGRFIILLAACLILPSSCLDTKPKTFPYKKIDFEGEDTTNQAAFNFNFAYRDSTDTTLPFTIYLQGATTSTSSLIGTCNLAGTNCVCDFLDSSGAVIETTDSSKISFEQTGNYFRCTQTTGTVASKVRIHNLADNITSETLDIDTTLTLKKLIGNDLTVREVRSVFSYSCNFTYLQKSGTTTVNFDCTDPGVACNGDNFCLLQTRFPFYLYSDTYTNNFGQKIAEKLYNDASTGTICGLQIAQYECADTQSTPLLAFGLYASRTGIWNTSVSLGAGPSLALDTYGSAAQVSPSSSPVPNECPPGLQKRVFYRVNPVSNTSASNSNYPANLVATQIGDPASAPSALTINQIPGGHCNGTSCTLPSVGTNTVSPQSYSSTGETVFCVIPSTLL